MRAMLEWLRLMPVDVQFVLFCWLGLYGLSVCIRVTECTDESKRHGAGLLVGLALVGAALVVLNLGAQGSLAQERANAGINRHSEYVLKGASR